MTRTNCCAKTARQWNRSHPERKMNTGAPSSIERHDGSERLKEGRKKIFMVLHMDLL